jgi:hypothetical protein
MPGSRKMNRLILTLLADAMLIGPSCVDAADRPAVPLICDIQIFGAGISADGQYL